MPVFQLSPMDGSPALSASVKDAGAGKVSYAGPLPVLPVPPVPPVEPPVLTIEAVASYVWPLAA